MFLVAPGYSKSRYFQLLHCSKLSINQKNWQWRHNLVIWCHRQMFFDVAMFSCQVSHWSKFHVNIITRDWPEIQKLKIHSSEFCPISWDWDELGMPNLTRMSLMKCYWMLQNARVTAFTVSELLRENQHRV